MLQRQGRSIENFGQKQEISVGERTEKSREKKKGTLKKKIKKIESFLEYCEKRKRCYKVGQNEAKA